MDDGLRMSVDSRTVTIYQNAGDPDYPDDEIGITMTQESFRKLIAISEAAFGVKRAVVAKPAEHFDAFWAAYPRKVAKDAAKKAWGAICGDKNHLVIIAAVEAIASSCEWSELQYIPHPASWLNGRRWLDVADAESSLGVFK